MPRAQTSPKDILANPALLAMPKVIEAHLENFFPTIVLFHGTTVFGKIKQCHIFVPESETHTRTYVLVYGQTNGALSNMALNMLRSSVLKLVDTIIQQDADILHKIYADTPQKIKLNNEVGMDWVRCNFESFPNIVTPNMSK
jgi:Vanillate O-demethylase oxygenase C-terminal domain